MSYQNYRNRSINKTSIQKIRFKSNPTFIQFKSHLQQLKESGLMNSSQTKYFLPTQNNNQHYWLNHEYGKFFGPCGSIGTTSLHDRNRSFHPQKIEDTASRDRIYVVHRLRLIYLSLFSGALQYILYHSHASKLANSSLNLERTENLAYLLIRILLNLSTRHRYLRWKCTF